MRKRSSRVALCIVGAAAFALAGCREEEVEAQAFPDLAACKAEANRGGQFSSADCDASFKEAEEIHVESAPRYDSLQVCEEQHGVGNCGDEEQVTGSGGTGGGIFMPLLTGYLIGSMLSRGGAAAQPLYRTADGRFTNAAGSSTYSGNSGRTTLGASQFNRPAATIGQQPMSRATVAQRGGFGGSAAGRSAGT